MDLQQNNPQKGDIEIIFTYSKICIICVRNELLNCLQEASATAGYGPAIIQLEMAGYQYVEAGKIK